jgi:putative transposase
MLIFESTSWSRIYWQDQGGNYWSIPCRNLALPPISLWELDEALRRLKAQGQSHLDEDKLMAMVVQQRRLVEQARSKTARLRRRRQPQALDEKTLSSSVPGSLAPQT